MHNAVRVETQECEVVKRNAVTLLGVVAIITAIVVVRSVFEQNISTQAQEEASAAAEENLVEAAEITEEAQAAEAGDSGAGDTGATESAPVPQDVAGFQEIEWADNAPEMFHVKFETTAGPFVIASYDSWAPDGHERFYELCKLGFFNDSGFFRVVPGFVVQFGLAADPKMTAQYKSKRLRDDKVRKSNQRGKVSFATSGPDSRTTQMFINYGDNANLDGMGFAPFGEVAAGMENVDKITSEYGERPQQGSITSQGTPYLKKNFPNLDFIQRVVLVKADMPARSDDPAPAPAETPAPADGAPATQ